MYTGKEVSLYGNSYLSVTEKLTKKFKNSTKIFGKRQKKL